MARRRVADVVDLRFQHGARVGLGLDGPALAERETSTVLEREGLLVERKSLVLEGE